MGVIFSGLKEGNDLVSYPMSLAEECHAMIHRKCFNYEMYKHINIHHPDLINVNIYNGKFVTNEKQKVRDTAKITTSPEPPSQDAPPSLHVHNRDITADCGCEAERHCVSFFLPRQTIYDLSSLLQKDTTLLTASRCLNTEEKEWGKLLEPAG